MSEEVLKELELLPRTSKEFDLFVKRVVTHFNLKNREHAAAVIARQIMHMPPDQGMTSIDYMGQCVIKNIAYQIAQSKGSQIAHKMQVDQLEALLKSNLNDNQSRDALVKACHDGSEYALKTMTKLFGEEGKNELLGGARVQAIREAVVQQT